MEILKNDVAQGITLGEIVSRANSRLIEYTNAVSDINRYVYALAATGEKAYRIHLGKKKFLRSYSDILAFFKQIMKPINEMKYDEQTAQGLFERFRAQSNQLVGELEVLAKMVSSGNLVTKAKGLVQANFKTIQRVFRTGITNDVKRLSRDIAKFIRVLEGSEFRARFYAMQNSQGKRKKKKLAHYLKHLLGKDSAYFMDLHRKSMDIMQLIALSDITRELESNFTAIINLLNNTGRVVKMQTLTPAYDDKTQVLHILPKTQSQLMARGNSVNNGIVSSFGVELDHIQGKRARLKMLLNKYTDELKSQREKIDSFARKIEFTRYFGAYIQTQKELLTRSFRQRLEQEMSKSKFNMPGHVAVAIPLDYKPAKTREEKQEYIRFAPVIYRLFWLEWAVGKGIAIALRELDGREKWIKDQMANPVYKIA
ncbi:MAG: hypothetical protein KJ601_03030 [Nanoarchaeota archaeon]|nr:hypothetical protein [Nanoarchaeota archaeon]